MEIPFHDEHGDRCSTTVSGDAGRVSDEPPRRPNPEVHERARRRTFTAQYKLDVLAEYDAAEDGAKGALLRREGLHSSHIVDWRRARDAGALAGLSTPRGRRRRDPQAERIAQLEADKQRLEQELAKARFVVDVQAIWLDADFRISLARRSSPTSRRSRSNSA